MDLIEHGNLVSPEVKVPLMLGGLTTVYGKKHLPNIFRLFGVKKAKDFLREDKYRLLSDFYHDLQIKVLTDHDYRWSIGKETHKIKFHWVKK